MIPETDNRVLCARTSDLPPEWLPEAGATRLSTEILFQTLGRIPPRWIPRPTAEQDPQFKQWIPYVLLADPAGRLAVYPRQGSESRLHGCWSVGIGGHVHPYDAPGTDPDSPAGWEKWLMGGLRRELLEEYPGAAPGDTRLLGLVHENQTPVGRVHIGLVFLHRLQGPAGAPGPELAGLEWVHPVQFAGASWPVHRLELWSRLALDLLSACSPEAPPLAANG